MYTLRFPFSLPPGREIRITEKYGELDGLNYSFKKQDRFYVITINGFPTEDTAKLYINNVWAGLMWVLLHRGLPPDAVFELGKIVYAEEPNQAEKNYGFKDPVDGFIDGSWPAVYPTVKRIVIETAGQIAPIQTYSTDDVIDYFLKGVAFPESEKVINDVKLRVALELWGAYFKETSANARFLTLVMALETLAPSTFKKQLVIELLDRWKEDVDELKKKNELDSEDAISLDDLSRELLFRKEVSIRQSIRILVLTTLQSNSDEDAPSMSEKAVQVYDHRSTLVHKGKLEPPVLSQAISDAKNIVERVLRVRFVQKVNPGGKSMV
jgi:hypothetical protein